MSSLEILSVIILCYRLLLRPISFSLLYIFSNMLSLTSRRRLHGLYQMPPLEDLMSRFSMLYSYNSFSSLPLLSSLDMLAYNLHRYMGCWCLCGLIHFIYFPIRLKESPSTYCSCSNDYPCEFYLYGSLSYLHKSHDFLIGNVTKVYVVSHLSSSSLEENSVFFTI